MVASVTLKEMLEGTEILLGQGGERVRVPAGVYDGQKIRLSGRGEAGPAGPGDLLIELKVELPADFERIGHDLTVVLPLRISDAVLGSTHEIELPDGNQVNIRVPVNSQNGQRLRLKEQGLPFKGGRGHLYVALKVLMPTVQDANLASLVKQLDEFYDEQAQ
jgi:DnaJ-class molecular chaperone